MRWTIPVPAAPVTIPLFTSDLVVVAYLPGTVAAFQRDDGRERWRAELKPDQPLATDGTLVFIAGGEAIHALRAADGSIAWRAPTGTLTAPLLVKDGWLIAAAAGTLEARRASDGTAVWTVAGGAQREAPAIAGDQLFVPQADGRLLARGLLDGHVIWERRLGGAPGEPVVVGDSLFAGAGKVFYCVSAGSGAIEWQIRVGASLRGRASSDGDRIFFTALDNLVRAIDRGKGAQRWQQGVPFRPLSGPVAAGSTVFVAGPGAEIRSFRAGDGSPAGIVTFPARIALGPAFDESDAGVVMAAVSGGLEESWTLSLTRAIAAPGGPSSR